MDPHPPGLACPTKAPLDQEHAHLTASPLVLDISWILDIMYTRSAFPTAIMSSSSALALCLPTQASLQPSARQHATQMWTLQVAARCFFMELASRYLWIVGVVPSRAPGRNPKHAWSASNPVLKAVVERMIFPYINLACTNSLYTSPCPAGDVRTSPVKPC